MCWDSKRKIDTIEHIAKDDIKCYKLMRSDGILGFSYYTKFTYEINILYTTKFGVTKRNILINEIPYEDKLLINEGFHSYSIEDTEVVFVDDKYRGSHYTIKNKPTGLILDCVERDIFYADCIIPKGAKYYINSYGEIVSDSIIVKDIHTVNIN